ncbi:MAG: hypothetical protein ABL902_01675 [Gallionella sp.]
MLQAVEAVIREGRVQPIEPIDMEENSRFLLIRLQSNIMPSVTPTTAHRHAGSAKGKLRVIEDDDAHLNDFSSYIK